MRPLILALLAVFATAGGAEAHAIGASGVGWTWDSWIVVPLAVALAAFLGGWLRLARRSGRGGGGFASRAGLFLAGWSVLVAALLSPLHQAGARSFSAHMLEHELLMLAAAPLLVLAQPLPVIMWGLPGGLRRLVGRAVAAAALPALARRLTGPVVATWLQAAALWLWHAPALFDRALQNDGWHIAQHASFLVSALLFWSAMLTRRPRNPALATVCLFATSVVSGALGAMMAFAPSPWYRPYAELGLAPLGLTPTEDQQLAGLLMWIPGGAVHAGAALATLAAALKPASPRVVET